MNKLENGTIVVDNNNSNQNNNSHNKQQQQEHSQIHNNKKHQHHNQQKQHNQNFSYNVNLKHEPQIPTAGKTTSLKIKITEQKTGNIVQDFETIHDKLMHLIAVGEDLSYFAH